MPIITIGVQTGVTYTIKGQTFYGSCYPFNKWERPRKG